MKRIAALLLVLSVLLSFSAPALADEEQSLDNEIKLIDTEPDNATVSGDVLDQGTLAGGVAWTFDSDGTLTISGEGDMGDFEWNYKEQNVRQPWADHRDDITRAVIGEGVTRIGDNAFRRCTSLRTIVIPGTVTEIGWCPFISCGALEAFEVSPENPAFADRDGVLFDKSMTNLLTYPANRPGDVYRVPDGVESIGDFEYSRLRFITMPGSVTEITGSAFSGCENLEAMILPEKLTELSSYLFWGCDSLQSIVIPKSVTAIQTSVLFLCDNIKDVYYEGTEEEWNAINIDSDNDELLGATIHFADSPGA